MDVVLEDAWLKSAIGETAGAIAILDRALGGLSKAAPSLVGSSGLPAELPASLVRAMLLRARLADQRGDRETSARWSQAALALWGGGDPELRAYWARGTTH
jgi:hypothetical protein